MSSSSSIGEDGSKNVEKKAVPRSLGKAERKNARKVSKMKQVVSKQVGVQMSDEPCSEWLIVWGFGASTGTTKNDILDYLKPRPVAVRLFVDQAYVFVRCSSLEDAALLKSKYHGREYDERQTLYVGFVEKYEVIPEEDIRYLAPFNVGLPEGLSLYPEFVTPEEEDCLIKNLFVDTSAVSSLRKRTVQHFGYEFRYGTNDVDPRSPLPNKIPDYVLPTVSKMISTGAAPAEPDQLTVNQYMPGQGIPPHCDTHSCFEGPIISLSLGSDTVMDFRQANSVSSVILPARSLLVMDGASRYGWTHGITPRKWDVVPDKHNGGITMLGRALRISLTFRRLKRGKVGCHCDFPNLCDTQKGKITDDNASVLENDLVHKVYENIAAHFTETRHKPWPKVREFVENLKPGDRMLDVGCANGKYFRINNDILEVGMDMSTGLLEKCLEKGNEVVRANALSLPFKDDHFESVISIAVLHHIATKERRQRFIEEIMRVLTPGGLGLIYVWAKDQNLEKTQSTWSERQQERNFYNPPGSCVDQVSDYLFLPIHDRDEEFPQNDMLVPWVNHQEKQNTVHHRYYHVFNKGELEELITDLEPAPKILDSYYEQGNWVVKFQKQGNS
ncbi:Alkylated DNA repair protein alkB 8 [Orchesella cincta]|uniref:Alkylated DNA repair protein alkB 8 n=1 Tax=Orchesella cincta TaxID=48709 RepID=A0A1D2NAP2_ORCCI|nr:Alkylated DNA repair protein alkB 8 [Orchesella cincta]